MKTFVSISNVTLQHNLASAAFETADIILTFRTCKQTAGEWVKKLEVVGRHHARGLWSVEWLLLFLSIGAWGNIEYLDYVLFIDCSSFTCQVEHEGITEEQVVEDEVTQGYLNSPDSQVGKNATVKWPNVVTHSQKRRLKLQ